MKFGSVEDPDLIDFSLPDDHPGTARLLSGSANTGKPAVHVGCAKWNRKELKNFYPGGTKDDLAYYASRFNAIELNATFYRNFTRDQVHTWYDKVPGNFRFFPKVNREISHRKWLSNISGQLDFFVNSVTHFREKLGTVFLQLRDNFAPKHIDRLVNFLDSWPDEVSLAVELRHEQWFQDPDIAGDLYQLLEDHNVANVIVDTAGRRDLLHMRLTNNEAFVRFVGANHPTDFTRLNEWAERIRSWTDQGLRNIHFFVHQNEEVESPLLAAHFIQDLNRKLGTDLVIPVKTNGENDSDQSQAAVNPKKDAAGEQTDLF